METGHVILVLLKLQEKIKLANIQFGVRSKTTQQPFKEFCGVGQKFQILFKNEKKIYRCLLQKGCKSVTEICVVDSGIKLLGYVKKPV